MTDDVQHRAAPLPRCTPPTGAFGSARGLVRLAGNVVLACWHAETDTLPRVVPHEGDAGLVDLVLPVGVVSGWGETARVEVEVRTDPPEPGGPRRHSSDDGGGVEVLNRSTMAREVRRGSLLRGEPEVLDQRRHSVDLDRAVLDAGNDKTFYRLTVRGLRRDALVEYTVRATTPMVQGAAESAFALRASAPRFTASDVRAVRLPDGGQGEPELRHWTLMHSRSGGMDHVRVDFLSTILRDREDSRPPVRVRVGDDEFDLGADRNQARPGDPVLIPLLDRQLDAVLVSVPVPADGSHPAVTVHAPAWEPGSPVDLSADPPEPVWLMIVNYCIQGLNDLFGAPVDRYEPPRTYAGVTMRDEYGTWSSRPGSGEDADPDGYALTFEGHRYFGVPSMWAFNAPVLTMLAHDCPEEFREIRADVAERGVLVPVNAGFGAHRTPYYTAEANVEEIRRGHEVIGAFLPGSPADGLAVYYPDQRLYGGTPQEHEVFAANPGLVRYLVLDRSTLCHASGEDSGGLQNKFFPEAAPGFAGNRLLRDPRTGATILPIEDAVREAMVGGGDDEAARGKAARSLREILMQGLHRNSVETGNDSSPVLLVYGDDADKASGNGWFDGDYSGRPVHFNDKYQATLCWLRDHPWVRVVTVADPDVAAAKPVPLYSPLASATCPSVDPAGATERDRYGNLLHFDTWEQQWAATRSLWLGTSLGELSRDVEDTLVGWPPKAAGFDVEPDQGMVDLAWMTFLALHHEMMWNKEPLEGGFVNKRCGVISPEDFVVAASLQLRNAHVYLAAAVWAGWARTAPDDRTHLNDGPLLPQVRAAGLGGADGLHWDRDLLPTDILYNREVLAVLDRNGGRVTHLFALDGRTGRAACVSGTPKVHQWTGPVPGRPTGDWLTCDGGVLENTVLTPNHLYVASDLIQAAPRVGLRREDRPRQPSPREWLYPDTFNEYVAAPDPAEPCVRYTYGPAVGPQPAGPVDDETFARACALDRAGKAAPVPGAATGVVWHEGPSFTKSFRLDGARLEVRYEDAPAGHLVGNEFCLDVRAALTTGAFQQRTSDPDWSAFRLTGPGGLHVTLTPGEGCRLTAPAFVHDVAGAAAQGIAEDWLRLHRVLTDAVELACPDGGAFAYTVDIVFTDYGA
ncbi:hypothetical protein [Pseudonocardia aurantiaca]|uniref:Uncharacterized protein n=1 Tax=Pseudonocardia aurantiaca TaxID=75290 RepID=A0ABW4FEG8_9PSEU